MLPNVGLLAMAHEWGLVKLATTVVSVAPDCAICQCTARFQDGRVFADVGDATPQHVQAPLREVFIRLVASRASARALRRALTMAARSVEELSGHEE